MACRYSYEMLVDVFGQLRIDVVAALRANTNSLGRVSVDRVFSFQGIDTDAYEWYLLAELLICE